MKVCNRHERVVAAPPERVVALIADLEQVWPRQIAPAPQPQADGVYKTRIMLWQEFDRPGAARAFRVISPHGLQLEHWFEVQPVGDGALLRHTVEGKAVGEHEAIWREQIEPLHELLLEALLDNVEAAVASADRGSEA